MCMVLIGDGHLHCAHVLEVLRPIVGQSNGTNSVRSFEQHFDYVLENRGETPITELFLLHQRRLLPDQPNRLGPDIAQEFPVCEAVDQDSSLLGDLPFRTNPEDVGGGKMRILLRVAGGDPTGVFLNEPEPMTLSLVRCGSVEFMRCGLSAADYAQYVRETHAVVPVRLVLETPLQPYDASRPEETRYLLRLHFQELPVKSVCAEPLVSGVGDRVLTMIKQTFDTWSPEFLAQQAIYKLRRIRDEGETPVFAGAADWLLQTWMLNPDRTVHTVDHRIAVVTSPRCLMVDHLIRGGMTFWQRRKAQGDKPGAGLANDPQRWLNIWTSGPAWNTSLDPAKVAREVLEILRKFRGGEERLHWYRVEALLPFVVTKIGAELGWESFVALLAAMKQIHLSPTDGEQPVPLLRDQSKLRWRLHEKWIETQAKLPEADDLCVELRRSFIAEQKRHTQAFRVFDERPFLLSFGICTVS